MSWSDLPTYVVTVVEHYAVAATSPDHALATVEDGHGRLRDRDTTVAREVTP